MLELARQCGIDAAESRIETIAGTASYGSYCQNNLTLTLQAREKSRAVPGCALALSHSRIPSRVRSDLFLVGHKLFPPKLNPHFLICLTCL